MVSIGQSPEECDATVFHSSNTVRFIKIRILNFASVNTSDNNQTGNTCKWNFTKNILMLSLNNSTVIF